MDQGGRVKSYKVVHLMRKVQRDTTLKLKLKPFPSEWNFVRVDFAEQFRISGLASSSIKALGFLHSGSCVLQDFPSLEQMGCHINHEADDRYRLRGLIWETDHKTTTPSFCHLFPQTGGSASLCNSKPYPMPSSDMIQTYSQNRRLI